ncbi:MAG: ABC transporter ATP-binding protein [bacterium]
MIFGKFINKYYLKYIISFVIGAIALIVVDYSQLRLPEIVGELIDALKLWDEANRPHEVGVAILETLYGYRLELVRLAIIMFIGRFTWRYAIYGAAIKIETDLREDMFNHSLKLGQDFYSDNKTGSLMALYNNDLRKVKECMGDGVLMLVDATFLGIFAFSKMLNLNVGLALICLIPLVIVLVFSLAIGKKMTFKFKRKQEAYEHLSDFTQENFSGISVVKAFVKEDVEIKEFNKINEENVETHMSFIKFKTIVDSGINFMMIAIILIILGAGGYIVSLQTSLTPGQLQEFIAYFGALTWPIMAVGEVINLTTQGLASKRRLEEFFNKEVTLINNDNVDDEIKGEIEFRNLVFKYSEDEKEVLNKVSFKINKGEHVGLIGPTGAGKSTIVDLLLRGYNINENQLFIDGKDIMDYDVKKVRDSIGYVPQDNFLFSETIKNNIAFAYETIEEEDIVKSAKLANVHDNIVEFNHSYETILGERGVTLSGGQKQRVSIARALIKDPKILILDDSLSAVDTKTEELILENVKKTRENKTTIFIAHRISTVANLDKIIVMKDHKIESVGTHQELLKVSDIYKELNKIQSLERKIEGEDNE